MKGKEFLHTMRAIKNLLLNCSAAGLVPSLSNGAFHSFSSYKWALTFGAKKRGLFKKPTQLFGFRLPRTFLWGFWTLGALIHS